MNKNNWKFDHNEVLIDQDGYMWHVLKRYKDIDSDARMYELADATHTEYKTVNYSDIEGYV